MQLSRCGNPFLGCNFMYRGYVRLWRKVEDNPIATRPAYLSVFLFILRNANHKRTAIIWNNQKTVISKGQFITSADKISKGTGVPRGTVERILKYLENEVMIEEQTTKKFRLISVINYKDYQASEEVSEEQVRNKRGTSEEQVDTNKNEEECRIMKKNVVTSGEAAEVDKMMKIFYGINPTLNWGNKTSRRAAADLIKRFGLEGASKMAEQIISVQGKPYAPTATTPYQMKEKLAQFKIYFDKQKNNKSKIVTI